MASCQAKPTKKRKVKKKSKKIQKHRYGFFSSQNGLGEAELERKKKLSF